MESLNRLEVYELFESRGCKITSFTKKSEKIDYVCKCGVSKSKMFSDFKKGKGCRTCSDKVLKETLTEPIVDDSGEIWKPVRGGFVSSLGNARSNLGKPLKLCPTKFRYHLDGKNQYVTRLIVEAFKLQNHDKLDNPSYVATKIDDEKGFTSDNIKVVHKSEIVMKPRSESRMIEKSDWTADRFSDVERRTVAELPSHVVYKNGEVWNGTRFLTFALDSEGYLKINIEVKQFKVHRIVCLAFYPIEGKKHLDDYSEYQVNHKDGNKVNNDADNLEWVSPSDNMLHSYSTSLSKKVRCVLQYSLDDVFIGEHISIAEASRVSKEPEHRIRASCNGAKHEVHFKWKFKNPEETLAFSEKYKKM